MTEFSLSAPARTILARGSRQEAASEIAKLGTRILLVRGRSVSWVDTLEGALAEAGCAVDSHWSKGEPTLDHVRQGVAQARAFQANCVVAVGGGAVVDLGKAIAGLCNSPGDPEDYLELGDRPARALDDPLPFVAIPTTAGTGAEATRNAVIGVPDRHVKISLRDPRLVPDLALIDPALTDNTPRSVTLAGGLDAITQLIESYLCNRANPITDALCRSSIPTAISALHKLMQTEDQASRDVMASASYNSGLALANSGLGIVHGLASVIGGRGAAHGAICGRLLAAGLLANEKGLKRTSGDKRRIIEVRQWLADGLCAPDGDGLAALRRFVDANDLPPLAALGVAGSDIAELAQQASRASSTKANPIELDQREICELLYDA